MLRHAVQNWVHIASNHTNGRYSAGACCRHAPRSGSNSLTSCRSTLSRVLSLISASLQSWHNCCLGGTITVYMHYIRILYATCICTPRWTADPLFLSEKFSKIHKTWLAQHVVPDTGPVPPSRYSSADSMIPLQLKTSANISSVPEQSGRYGASDHSLTVKARHPCPIAKYGCGCLELILAK